MKILSDILNKFDKLRPRPFKFIQKKLDIEHEWAEFKYYLKPHKYKFYFLGGVLLLPYYKPFLSDIY